MNPLIPIFLATMMMGGLLALAHYSNSGAERPIVNLPHTIPFNGSI